MDPQQTLPLSPSQEIIWVHEQLTPGSRAYNFTGYLTLRGELDVPALIDALGRVLDRHDGLRLELVESVGERPRQRVRARCTPRFRSVDLSTDADPAAAFAELLRSESLAGIDRYAAPLLRWCLVRMSADEHRLIHVEHHLIHDGRSFLVLVEDLLRFYSGDAPAAAPVSYLDHLDAVAAVDPDTAQASLDFWHDELAGADLVSPLAGLARPGATRSHDGAQFVQVVDATVADALRRRAAGTGHTVFSTVVGLFGELIRRHSGQDDLVVGSAVGNRPAGHEDTVGMFVNTLPLRLRLAPEQPADDVLDEVTETVLRVLPHQGTPVQQLTASLGLHTSGADNPLFNVAFSSVDDTMPQPQPAGLDVELMEGFNSGTTRFDLDLVFFPDSRRRAGARSGPAGMHVKWDYDVALFDEATIALLADRFGALLAAYVASPPETPLAALDPVPTAPVADLAPPTVPTPADPAATAVVSGSTRWTHAELDRRVDAVAAALTGSGVAPGRPVAVVLPRGVDGVVTLLACLRLGAVYCPLSPTDPPSRLTGLLDRLAPALVVTARPLAPMLRGATGVPVAVVDADEWPAAVPGPALDGAAYVMHTSGSTGLPKPVVVTRDALDRQVAALRAAYELTPDDRVLMFAQPYFDVTFEEVLPTLAAGACLVVPRDGVLGGAELVTVAAARGVTVANLPTSYVVAVGGELREALAEGRWTPRLLVVGGELLPGETVRDLVAGSATRVLNAYGVTEATITSTVHEIDPVADAGSAPVPLGTDLPGSQTSVLDSTHRPLPDGGVGEIAIAGPALALGYLHDPATTAARFVTVDGVRRYLTGDRGYRDRAGRLHFLGRIDDQIKFRGYRIDPDEIRTALLAHPAVADAVVVLTDDAATQRTLVAYVQSGGAGVPDVDGLRSFLADRLPAYLVPASFVVVDPLPRTPAGKIDRAALPRPTAPTPGPTSGTAPTAGPEERIARIWRHVLRRDDVARDDNFFDLGGHSLLLLQAHALVASEFARDVPVVTMFRYPTVATLARWLDGGETRTAHGSDRADGRSRLAAVRARRPRAGTPGTPR